jgi:hypothetical protein
MDLRRGSALLFLCLAGCTPPPAPTPPPPTPAPSPAPPASADSLRAALPPAPKGFAVKLFRERPGLVSVHLKKADSLLGTFVLSDTRAEPQPPDRMFAGAKERVHGWPAVSTAMGGGVAVLVEKRFKVEAVSLGPAFGPERRDAWLAATDFDALAALARTESRP